MRRPRHARARRAALALAPPCPPTVRHPQLAACAPRPPQPPHPVAHDGPTATRLASLLPATASACPRPSLVQPCPPPPTPSLRPCLSLHRDPSPLCAVAFSGAGELRELGRRIQRAADGVARHTHQGSLPGQPAVTVSHALHGDRRQERLGRRMADVRPDPVDSRRRAQE
eukprot:7385465-Prymnesium_polylepis.1